MTKGKFMSGMRSMIAGLGEKFGSVTGEFTAGRAELLSGTWS